LGLGPSSTQISDIVAVLHGGRVPFVLRVKGELGNAHLELVGECFVYAIMDRQVYDMLEEDGVMTGVFKIH